MRGVRDAEKEEHKKESDAKERSALQSLATDRAYSSVSFPLEKETKEPPSLPFLVSHFLGTTGYIWAVKTNKYKHGNENTLLLFVSTLLVPHIVRIAELLPLTPTLSIEIS